MEKLFHAGNVIIAGFIVMVVMMSVLVFKTISQDVQMVEPNYYAEELKVNEKTLAMNNADSFEKQFSFEKNNDFLTINIPQELAKNIEKGEIAFYCASDMKNDKKVILESKEDGKYTTNIQNWKKSEYIAKIAFTSGGKEYFKKINITI